MTELPEYRIYIAGPMTSVGGNFNFPLFDHVAKRLQNTNKCMVFNPADHARIFLGSLEKINKMGKKELADARRKLLDAEINWIMKRATHVLMLPGWERSNGAKAEYQVAVAFEIPVQNVPNIVLYDEPLDGKWEITNLDVKM